LAVILSMAQTSLIALKNSSRILRSVSCNDGYSPSHSNACEHCTGAHDGTMQFLS
jgi:hypothetical protein